jgi:hypothetical protein
MDLYLYFFWNLKYFMTAFSPFVKYVSLAFGHICGKSTYEELKNTIFSVSFLYYFSHFVWVVRHHVYGVCLMNGFTLFSVTEIAALRISLIKVFSNKNIHLVNIFSYNVKARYNLFLGWYEDFSLHWYAWEVLWWIWDLVLIIL